MDKQVYKTTLKCNGCVATLQPFIEKLEGLDSWSVDLNSDEKKLTVEGKDLDEEKVKKLVEESGYKAERLQ